MLFPVFIPHFVKGPTRYIAPDNKAIAAEMVRLEAAKADCRAKSCRTETIEARMTILSEANNDALNRAAYREQATREVDEA